MTNIAIIQWDITEQDTDAIVNAANRTLLWWWWVDGAIHSAWWQAIYDSCLFVRKTKYPDGLPTSEAVATTWWNLPAKWVIHTVWPIFSNYKDDERKDVLLLCYRNCLKVALDHWIKTISFPSISTGAYRCPIEECSKIAIEEVKNFVEINPEIEEVRFVLFSEKDYEIYKRYLDFK